MRVRAPSQAFPLISPTICALGAWLLTDAAAAESLRVGPGQTYATPCAAVAAASPNAEILIAPGTYTDSCALSVPGLTLRGVDGRPKIDLSGTDHPAQYKGIYVVTADSVTLENLELSGAHISAQNGENAAAIRLEGQGLTVRRCFIHDNQNGILGGSAGTLTVEYSEFFRNGMGNGCSGGGCTHNLYIGKIDTLFFRYNWSHGIAQDTSDKGHLLKSRAAKNYIEYNRISGEDAADSYEIDLPNGGLAVLIGNVIQKGPASGNTVLFSWGEEGVEHPDQRVFAVNNTFINARPSGTFIHAQGATLTAKNNLLVGAGAPSSTGNLSSDNLSGIDPHFVDGSAYDYHLRADSPAIGKAVAAGMADAYALIPSAEYLHPNGRTARATAEDVGAFEFATKLPPDPSQDGAVDADAGSAASDAGAPQPGVDPSSPAPTSGARQADGGCAVRQQGSTGAGSLLALALGWVWLWRRRRSATG
ncbi:MAG: right-handed parallel beta-helix repeat-containing protein [Myxococcales bacterium]